jgi:hypothetical protein
MKNKNPINVFNGLKSEIQHDSSGQPREKTKSRLVPIKDFQNAQNITKPFVKPISKIV